MHLQMRNSVMVAESCDQSRNPEILEIFEKVEMFGKIEKMTKIRENVKIVKIGWISQI